MFENLVENLKANGYEVSCFETKEEATAYLNQKVDGTTVGFGGSVTLAQMGLCEALSTHNEVFAHMKPSPSVSPDEMRAKEHSAKVYFSSVNALAESGEIVNIDGTCNRVASIFYGHERVFLVVGKNKICKTYEEAVWRARNVAAPKNAQRLKMQTPCAKNADRCYDCNSPQRICLGLAVLWKKPRTANMEIVLINEDLGY